MKKRSFSFASAICGAGVAGSLVVGAVSVSASAPSVGRLRSVAVDAEPVDGPADVTIDRWDGVWGQSLGDVTAGREPTATVEQRGEFESPVGIGDQYATRMRTLLTPEADGRYRFWISGDDDVRLFMDPTGDDPAEARRIAYIAGWTDYRQFDRFWSQRSAWFELQAGTSYYVELIGKEGSGGDHYTLAWEQLGGFERQVVPASVLEATKLGSGGWRPATPLGLPSLPAPMTDPQWSYTAGPETLAVAWARVEGAEWYDVRLEGGGQAIDVTVDSPTVDFDNLVPDSRYLIEVAPGSAAGRQPARSRVVMTVPGPYPTPVAPVPAGDRQAVSYDRWDAGWWTLTSVPEGLAPFSTNTLSTGLETIPMQGENHAARLRAIVTPDVSGAYRLHLSGDDDARLVFNPVGPDAAGAGTVAYVSGWTEQYQWDRFQSQTSDVFELVAGRQYYIEAAAVHGLGLDHLEVGWSLDGGPIEVIPAARLSPTPEGAGGWRQSVPSLQFVDASDTTTTTTTTSPPTTVPAPTTTTTTTTPTTTTPTTTTATTTTTTVPASSTTVPAPTTTVPAPTTTVPASTTTLPPAECVTEQSVKDAEKAARFAQKAAAEAQKAADVAVEHAAKMADAARTAAEKAAEQAAKDAKKATDDAKKAADVAEKAAKDAAKALDEAAKAAAAAAEKAARHLDKAAKFAAKAAGLGGLDCNDLVASGDPVAFFPTAVTGALATAGKSLGSVLGS